MDANADASVSMPAKISSVLDLPDEILKEICSHCLQCDWICLSLVCKRFRELAAAQLYRNFHIVFPDEGDSCFDSPIDGLAGGLATFVSSDYNYAKHLREISLDTLSVGDKAETAYKPYLASVSCGKFMNTLLLLTLRKAMSLDSFRWNIRVELSRPAYKVLHGIQSLRHLHLRLQAGPSLYEPPPPLPYPTPPYEYTTSAPSTQWVNPGGGPPEPVGTLYGPPPVTASLPAVKSIWKHRASKKPILAKEPPTISGFQNLESLSVLDMDSLDIITEIKACVRNSSSTLRKLKLSFSDGLAKRARKPCVDADLDESEDDEFQVVPLSLTPNYDNNGPAKVFRAQEERRTQESVLGRIFEVEPYVAKSFLVPSEDQKEEDLSEQVASPEGQRFIDQVNEVFRRMVAHVNGTTDYRYLGQVESLDAIAKAAKQYVKSEEARVKAASAQGPSNPRESPPSSQEPEAKSTPGGSTNDNVVMPGTGETSSPADDRSEHPIRQKSNIYDANPDDIDITAPEEQLGTELQPAIDADLPSSDKPAITARETRDIDSFDEDAESRLKEARQRLESIHRDVVDIQHEMNVVEAEIDDATAQAVLARDKKEANRDISEYARDTRGIGLHSLSIHLIPVKASVLGKAIDLHMLRRITLLNVGEQKKFWALMMKENNLRPLPLRKVFTDDVCLQFLQLVSELDCAHEVFMLQRSAKYKPESFAPNPGTTIEQIRKFVLRKHLPTLKRLMIKNQADESWDLDEKTTQLICRRGKALEELAVIMGMRAIHILIQHIHGLVNLRALQLVSFRTEDTCLSVVHETRRFIADALSHHPMLKLEWLSLGDEGRATRIVRKFEVPKSAQKGRGKGKEVATSLHGDGNSNYPVMPISWDTESESDEDEDDDGGNFPRIPRLELVEGFAFYDVFGVRIFKKEVASGRL
ncbi:hypothetical protein GGS23DRAFT_550930 [Durotheca rogersii]|uniref:uncharacterized protein n=1 Tax=Durotheca rogersii TaxID=419775 RepID=UPI00221EC8DF|nr:uncharacterized protein GGS23DRAFT_550930 [Durotheca rogersii]KAI5866510.1 hypothetical protein GGS23DRAFT_550930 [Durotheca rogersii]